MKRVHDPSLASLIQETSAASHADQLKGALRGAQNKSSGAFEDAINKLNEMTEEAQLSLDTETQRCQIAETSMTTEMSWLQVQVKRHNSDAASARGCVLIAQGNIATLETLLKETTIKFETHKRECIRELNELNAELKIVLEDVQVMNVIIGLIDCKGASASSSSFVQCAHCDDGIMLQHAEIQHALHNLQSQVAKDLVKSSMVRPGVFTQGGFRSTPELPVGWCECIRCPCC